MDFLRAIGESTDEDDNQVRSLLTKMINS